MLPIKVDVFVSEELEALKHITKLRFFDAEYPELL